MLAEIRELRLLDAEVAIRCFGWQWWVHTKRDFLVLYPPQGTGWEAHNNGDWMRPATPEEIGSISKAADWDRCCSLWNEQGRALRMEVPRFSTSMEDTGLVLEWLRGPDGASFIDICFEDFPSKTWYIRFIWRSSGVLERGAFRSIPEGLCRLIVEGS